MGIVNIEEAVAKLKAEIESMDKTIISINNNSNDLEMDKTIINMLKESYQRGENTEYEKKYKSLERKLKKLESVEEKIKRGAYLSKRDVAYMLDCSLPQIDIWLRDLYNPIPSFQIKAGGSVKFKWAEVSKWYEANTIR
jgi:hypothetical protein